MVRVRALSFHLEAELFDEPVGPGGGDGPRLQRVADVRRVHERLRHEEPRRGGTQKAQRRGRGLGAEPTARLEDTREGEEFEWQNRSVERLKRKERTKRTKQISGSTEKLSGLVFFYLDGV